MKKGVIILIRNAASQDFGGGERFPVFLSETLHHEGFSPVIVSRSQKLLTFAKSRQVKTVKGWWLPHQKWNGAFNLLLPLYALWQLVLFVYYLALFLKLKPSVVHIQSKDDFIAATHAAKIAGARIIWTDHADLKHVWRNVAKPWKNPIGKYIYRNMKHVSTLTFVSESEKSLTVSQLPLNSNLEEKITVIHNGVVDAAAQYPHVTNDAFCFLVASRLVIDKGISEAIEAFKRLYSVDASISLTIIGDGPDMRVFQSSAAECSAIKFLGHQTDPLRYMASANVFLQPAYHEGFSVALVEASMMSLPIIATDVGGNKEIISSGKTGLLVPVKDISALVNAMQIIRRDSALRRTIQTNARRQYLEKFQFDHIVKEQFIPLYESDFNENKG